MADDKAMVEGEEEEMEVEEMLEEIEALEESLEDAESEIEELKAKIVELEEEKKMEGWEEWGQMAGNNLTREDLQSIIGQARVSEDALVTMFRRGVTAGIELMVKHVEQHIDDAWAPYAKYMEEDEDEAVEAD